MPLVGFGEKPTLIALFAYGLLPIFENTMVGLKTVPPAVLEAASGMGMSARQRLLSVELPLAMPLILEGIRLSLVINVGTATIGSTVAAKGLGEVIIAGLLSNNTAFILQGGLVTGLMAVLLYDALASLERRVCRTSAHRLRQALQRKHADASDAFSAPMTWRIHRLRHLMTPNAPNAADVWRRTTLRGQPPAAAAAPRAQSKCRRCC